MGVEIDPLVHGMPADVPPHVVYMFETRGAGDCVLRFGAEAGQESAVVVSALNECVDRVAIRCDRRSDDATVFIGCFCGGSDRERSAGSRFDPGLSCVVYLEGNHANAIAVACHMVCDGAVRPQ